MLPVFNSFNVILVNVFKFSQKIPNVKWEKVNLKTSLVNQKVRRGVLV